MALPGVYIIRVTASVFQVLGLFLTAWRIYIRLKIRRFWWEDAWATILLLTGLLWVIAQWVFLLTNGLTSIVTTWIYSIGFTSIVTLVRMSVLFSIIRIIHGSPRLLRFAYACVAFYAACWVILIIEKVVQCASDPSWHHAIVIYGKQFCLVKPRISIFEFTSDCVAVLILVILPLRMLWRVKLPKHQRRMILCIFASSVVLAFGALFHTIGQILNIFAVMIAGINVEVALSFYVCNLLVVVTYTYRFLRHGRGADTTEDTTTDDDDFTTPLTRPVQPTTLSLTTIDLEVDIPNDSCQPPTRRGVSSLPALTEGLIDSKLHIKLV
ncbi:hypothetical protein V8E55_010439 [Tylopilus felleus]